MLVYFDVKHNEKAIDNKLYIRYIQLYPTTSNYIPSYPIMSHHIPPYPTIFHHIKTGITPKDIRQRGALYILSSSLVSGYITLLLYSIYIAGSKYI